MRLLNLRPLGLLVAGLMLAGATRAQAPAAWPRDPITGRIVFRGEMNWPDTVRTETQRQALAWRWYRRGLTSDRPVKLRKLRQTAGATYADLPRESCYQLRVAGPDNECYRLCFQLQLTASSSSLRYQLTDFELFYAGYDVSTSVLPEDGPTSLDTQAQAVLVNFRQQLAIALKGW